MWLTLALIVASTATSGEVRVRSDHAQIQTGNEAFRLVSGRAPMTAVVRAHPPGTQIVIEVVRVGYATEPTEGAVPLAVTVENQRHVFPNRPALVRTRLATWAGEKGVSSFAVRYPLPLPPNRNAVVRVALRRPSRGGLVGVRVLVEKRTTSTLAALDQSAGGRFAFPAKGKRKASTRVRPKRNRTSRSSAPTVTTPVDESGADDSNAPEADAASTSDNTGSDDTGSDDTGSDDNSTDDTGTDATDAGAAGTDDAAVAVDLGEGATGAGMPSEADAIKPAEKTVEEVVPPAPSPQGRLKIVVRNEMGTFFELEERTITIDGVVVHAEPGPLPYARTVAFNRAVEAGAHDVEIRMTYVGNGGVFFQYVNGYTFHLNDRRRVQVPRNTGLDVVISGFEAGGPFAELTDKPGLRWETQRPKPR